MSGSTCRSVLVVLTGVFVGLMFAVGAPLAVAMLLAALAALWYMAAADGNVVPLVVVPQRMFTIVDSFPLMAVPYYILAGELMLRGGISLRLVTFASSLVGRFRGGLCLVAVLASMIFSGVSGSGAADTAAVGSITIPAMIKKGYPRGFVAALQAFAGAMGPIIPPSIIMLLYASIANQSPARMFLGGILPGIVFGVGLMVVAYVYSVRNGFGGEAPVPWQEIVRTTIDASWALVSPVIVLGGIVSGVFTATEAGVVAVVYALFVGKFVYRELAWRTIPEALLRSALMTTIVMFIVSASGIFGWLLAAADVPTLAAQFISSLTDNPLVVALLVIAFLLVVGGLMEEAASIIILVPVLHPLGVRFGFDPLHWAVLLSITLVMGTVTPPVASFLFISTAIAQTTLADTVRHVWPFLALMIAVVVLSLLVPDLILFLPRLLLGG